MPWLFRLVSLELVLTLLVILGGAFVRASGSGAGCGEHWPLCNGVAIPINPRIETIVEFTHRVSSGLSLLLFVGIFFSIRKFFARSHPIQGWTNLVLLSFFLEAAIGALLVLKKLVATDTSGLRAAVIAFHLVNTYVLLAGLVGVLWNLSSRPSLRLRDVSPRFRWIFVGWGLVGALGAVVALGDTLFPALSFAHGLEQDLDAGAHFLIRLRILHPLLAVGVAILTLLSTITPKKIAFSNAVRTCLLAELALGLANWLLLAPISLQMLHLLLADISWLAVVAFALAAAHFAPSRSGA